MLPYQIRVIDERIELAVKLTALRAFLLSPEYGLLPAEEQRRLRQQQSAMQDYTSILRERIEAFVCPGLTPSTDTKPASLNSDQDSNYRVTTFCTRTLPHSCTSGPGSSHDPCNGWPRPGMPDMESEVLPE